MPELTDNWFLAALPVSDRAWLKPHLQSVLFKRGQVLCEPGRELDAVWFFRTGLSSDVHVLEDGFEIEVCTFGRESAFGLGAALEPAVSLVRGLVQVPGGGWRLPATAFRQVYAESEALRALVLRHTQAAIVFMARSMACNRRHTLEQRLARWLLTGADHAQDERLALTHEFLAIMLGVTRPSLSLALGDLQKQGLVALERGAVGVADRAGLTRRACGCYQATKTAWAMVRPAEGRAAVAGI